MQAAQWLAWDRVTGCWLKGRAGIPPKVGWAFDVDGAVVCTGAGAGAGGGVVSGSVVVAGTVGAGVLVVEVVASVLLAARAPMIPRKPPTERSAVATRAWAATWRRWEEGLTDITRPSLRPIAQNHLRAG
jgi:hypothetical protein